VEAPAPPLPTPVPETPVAAADPPPESGELNFHVLDPEGREVEEATVGFTSRADQRHRTDRILRAPQTRWSLAPGTYRGLVTAPGFGEKPFAAEVSPGATTTVRLSLDRGLALAGVLVDDLRKPIAGARVFARSGSNPIRVRTDDEGRFAIGGLQALAYDLRSEPDGCDEAVLSGVVAPRAGLVLMAPRRGAVTALLRVPTGFPIPERVTVFRPASRGSSEMHASSRPWNDGRFELEGVPTGSARGRRRR
jgi:hypothetical protein